MVCGASRGAKEKVCSFYGKARLGDTMDGPGLAQAHGTPTIQLLLYFFVRPSVRSEISFTLGTAAALER